MKKVAIVGVEGSGKTVMLAGLGDLYTYPDEEGYFLAPKNFGTAAYVAEKIERMRKGEWPSATAGDEMQGLDWTLRRRKPGSRGRPDDICEVSFLDFAGEVYRTAFGIGAGDVSLAEQAEELKRYVSEADDLIVLINLRDVIVHGIRDKRVQEAMWITNAILDAALAEDAGRKAPHAAIVLSQADSYTDTIEACGGAAGVLQKYLPHVANNYGWLDIFSVQAVDKTAMDDDGNIVPARDFSTEGLRPIMGWVLENIVDDEEEEDEEEALLGHRKAVTQGHEKAGRMARGLEESMNSNGGQGTARLAQGEMAGDLKRKTIKLSGDFGVSNSGNQVGDNKSCVILKDYGKNKIAVIAKLREIFGWGLAKTKDVVESAPVAIVSNVSRSEADRIGRQMQIPGVSIVISHDGRGLSLGESLRAARLAAGYSIEQVAAKTRMLPKIVQELENDDFHSISTSLYGRGFVKLYAECVGLDPAPLDEAFLAEYN